MTQVSVRGGRIRNTFSALASGAIAQYQCVYAYSADRVKAGNNADTTKADIIGISLAALVDGQRGSFIAEGEIVNNSWSWTAGSELYVGDTGELTQTLASNGKVICQVGVALTATKIYISIDKTIIKTA